MTDLLLGPLLRHVGSTDATVWVETAGPCEVEILGHTERTWAVAGHHYALVVVTGLQAGTATEYEVRLDGELVWPPAASGRPPCRIRTLAPDRPVHIAFGSCRYASAEAVTGDSHFDADALDCYAHSISVLPEDQWPAALVMLGDQVYADETSPATRRRIRRAGTSPRAPGTRSRTSRSTPGSTSSRGPTPMCAGCCPPCPAR